MEGRYGARETKLGERLDDLFDAWETGAFLIVTLLWPRRLKYHPIRPVVPEHLMGLTFIAGHKAECRQCGGGAANALYAHLREQQRRET